MILRFSWLRRAVFAPAMVCVPLLATAQFEGDGNADAGTRGTLLGSLVDDADAGQNALVCQSDQFPDQQHLHCLLDELTSRISEAEQRGVLVDVFARRLGETQTAQEVITALGHTRPSNQGETINLSDLTNVNKCPGPLEISPFVAATQAFHWQETAQGLRDLSPPLIRVQSPGTALLVGAMGMDARELRQLLRQTPCAEVRRSLARALILTYLSADRVSDAQALALEPYMPRRFGRQVLGAGERERTHAEAEQEALAEVLRAQQALANPGDAQAEVGVLIDEIRRQFALDFLLGKIWRADARALSAMGDDPATLGQIARLLSEDAKLMQQGYGAQDTRIAHQEIFAALIQKQGYDLLTSIDLLVPEVMAQAYALAVDQQPLSATSLTRFERDQEVLALLIRANETQAVEGVWAALTSPQRQEAVLFAMDQGAWQPARLLYGLLRPEDMTTDFVLRFALYQAVFLQNAAGEGS